MPRCARSFPGTRGSPGPQGRQLSAWHVRRAVHVLRGGGVLAYPTEGVFGIGCDPFDAVAVERVLLIKGRAARKGLILIAADVGQVEEVAESMGDEIRARLVGPARWPTTWVLPSRRDTPVWLTGGRRSIAVRLTAHPVAAALCASFGGLVVSTSANLGGRRPARTLLGLPRRVRRAVDWVIPGTVGASPGPSEIRDATTGRVLRPAVAGAPR